MIPLHRVASLLYNTPLLITPEAGLTISNVLSRAIAMRSGAESSAERPDEQIEVFAPVKRADGSVEVFSPRASRFVGMTPIDPTTGRPAPYAITPNGTGVISIVGELTNRGRWTGASSGIVSYEGIKHQLAMIGRDQAVKKVIVDMETPGGACLGCFDTAASMRKLAAIKPVTAFVNGMSASAGYALASGASRIVSIPEGRVGSIGVFLMHVDFSVALQMEGIKPTFIFAGAHKVDGHPCEPLPKDVRERFQAQVDSTYAMFVSTVATGRKGLTEDAIRGTEALMYDGADAIKLGLIDAAGTFEDLLMEIEQPESMTIVMNGGAKAATEQGEDDMSKLTEAGMKMLVALKLVDEEAPKGGNAAIEAPQLIAGMEIKKDIHLLKGTAAKCGADGQFFGDTTVADATCGDCLRLEIAERDAAAKAREAETKAAATAERKTRIAAEVTAFQAKCANAGKEPTEALLALFSEAKASGNDAAAKHLETIAAGFGLAGPLERLANDGPDAEAVAARAKGITDAEIGPEAARRLKASGVKQGTAEWRAAYPAMIVKVKAEMSGGASAAA